MSVSLMIDWGGGAIEEVAVAGYRGAKLWAEEARKIGLTLVPHFSSVLVIEPDRIPLLMDELTKFRKSIAEKGPEYAQWLESIDRLMGAFERLKRTTGWSASIG